MNSTSGWRRALAWAQCGALAAFPAGLPAQNLPNLGEESAAVISPQMERRVGEGYYRELRRDPAYFDDAEGKAYLVELGERLIAASPEPGMDVEFFLIKDASINAFAMLGGFIGVNTGLIIAAQSESEVASVLGHELAHLTQKHIARGVSAGQKSSMVSMAAMLVALLAARSNSQMASGALIGAQAYQVQSQLAYSRDFEREADRVGFDILVKGNFDATAMPAFFEKLQRAGRANDTGAPVYVRSHPLTTERIADVRSRAQGLRVLQRADSPTFHLLRARLRALSDPTTDGLREARAHFQSQLDSRSYASEVATRFGLATVMAESRDFAAAAKMLAQIPATSAHPMIDALKARVKAGAGDTAGAVAAYRAALAAYPRAAYLRYGLATVLQDAGRHTEAIDLLAEPARATRVDPRVHEMRARSFAALGKTMSQHQALGEYYALTGSAQAALEQFQIARCAGGGDFYQQSIIDARMRDMWDRMVAERDDSGEPGKDGGKGGPGLRPVQRAPQRCT